MRNPMTLSELGAFDALLSEDERMVTEAVRRAALRDGELRARPRAGAGGARAIRGFSAWLWVRGHEHGRLWPGTRGARVRRQRASELHQRAELLGHERDPSLRQRRA